MRVSGRAGPPNLVTTSPSPVSYTHLDVYKRQLYVLEANPRASRTVPFVSKATDTQLAKA